MRQLAPLIMLAACACDREPQQNAATPAVAIPEKGMAMGERKSEAPLVLPLPKDQTEVDRLILAGYTPHGEHLHPPGVSKCPLADGKEAVM